MKKLFAFIILALCISFHAKPTKAQFDGCAPGLCGASGGSASCSGFTIPSTSNLVVRIDACVVSSFTLSSGIVQTAIDQSSNAYTFSAGSVGPAYVLNGFNARPTIVFQDGATLQSLNNAAVALGTGNELTIFAAATLSPDAINGDHQSGRLASYTAGGAGNDFDNNNSFAFIRDAATSHITFDRNTVATPNVNVGYNLQHRIIFTLKSDGTRTLYVDGIPTSVAGAVANFASPGYMSMGGSQFNSNLFGGNYGGLVSEWGVYSSYLDATAVGLLDTYLKNKWGM